MKCSPSLHEQLPAKEDQYCCPYWRLHRGGHDDGEQGGGFDFNSLLFIVIRLIMGPRLFYHLLQFDPKVEVGNKRSREGHL